MKTRWTGDVEADGLLDEATVIHCAVFKEFKGGRIVEFTPQTIHLLPTFLEENVEEVIIHNGIGYDFPLIKKILGYEFKGKIYDTLVLSRMLNPNRLAPIQNRSASPHGIEAWGYRVGRGKPEHDDWSTYSEAMLHRCKEDVEINELTYYALQDEMSKGDWSRAVPMTMQLFRIINKMEEYGWLVDQEWMHECIVTLNAEFTKIDNYITPLLPWVMIDNGVVNKPFKKDGNYSSNMEKWFLNTSKSSYEAIDRYYDREVVGPFCRILYRKVDVTKRVEMIDLLMSEGWIPEEWNINKDTKEKTSPKLTYKDKFIGIESDLGIMAAKRVQVRHRHSLIKGLFKLIRPDGRISQRITGLAVTGRAKHAAVVNIPNSEAYFGTELRKIFIVPDDKVLIGVDSDSCQNRMLAARVGDPDFTKIILEGTKEDKTTIHYVNQTVLHKAGFDVSYGMVKNIGYAFNFGASDTKLGLMVRGTKETGAEVRAALLSVSAGLERLLDSLQNEWDKTAKGSGWRKSYGSLVGLDGRPINIESSHALLVYLLQSDEAIMMSYAYLYLYKWCEEKGWKWGEDWAYVGWIHDEFQCEVNPIIKDEFKALAERSIEYAGKYLKIQIEHIGDADEGRSWADTH